MRHWKLEVVSGQLAFVAPHGTFYAREVAPAVAAIVERLSAGTIVECECEGKAVDRLHVRRIVKLLRRGSSTDVVLALELDDDDVLADFEQLPQALREEYAGRLSAWQAKRPASWRALRHIPLARWTTRHLTDALETIADGGTFGTADADAITSELADRGITLGDAAEKLATLRAARATEGDTQFRAATELVGPRVVGGTAEGIILTGTEDERPMVVLVGRDGVERQRWPYVAADFVVGDVRLTAKRAFRLSDGEQIYEYPYARGRFDHELIYCVLSKNWSDDTMRSELRRITGELVLHLDTWIDDLWWDPDHIYTRAGDTIIAYHRDGTIAPGVQPPKAREIRVETANDMMMTYPHDAPPWAFGSWTYLAAGAWHGYRHTTGGSLLVAPREPGATWTALHVVGDLRDPCLAPPWMTFRFGETFLAIALPELVTASQIIVDGERVIERSALDPAPSPSPELVAWYEAIVATGVIPPLGNVERDQLLLRRVERGEMTPAALRNVVFGTPSYVEHGYVIDREDDFYDELNRILAPDGIVVEETARELGHVDEITIQVRRGTEIHEEEMEALGTEVVHVVDEMLDRVGSTRRLFVLVTDTGDHGYLVITPAERAALVAAGIVGI